MSRSRVPAQQRFINIGQRDIPLPDRPSKNVKQAFLDGAHAQRGGIAANRAVIIFSSEEEQWAALAGWRTQALNPGRTVDFSFYLNRSQPKVNVTNEVTPRSTKGNSMTRTKEELEQAKADYQPAYDAYAEEETKAGREPTPFDEAFAEHLEALDAEAAEAQNEADAEPSVAVETATKGKKGKAKAKKAKEPKEPKAPKLGPKNFRPTSDDRKVINAAAADAATKAKAEGTPRLKFEGKPYAEFLSGKALRLDENGNGDCSLQVVTAKDTDTVVGRVDVTVRKGEMKAKGVKAA